MLNNAPTPLMSPIQLAETPQAAPTDLFATFGGVIRRWKLIALVAAVTLTATYGGLKMVPSLYKSTTEILIFDPQRQMDDAVQKRISPFIDAVDNQAMNTEIEVIKSKSVALRVAKELALDRDSEFQAHRRLSELMERLGFLRPSGPDDATETTGQPSRESAKKLDRAADVLLQRLQVERVLFSYILNIAVTSEDPVKAQRLAATVADDYLASQREARQDALQRVASWLKGRVDELQSRVLETEASIEKLKAESGITDTVSEQQIQTLNGQLMAARGEVFEQRSRLEQAHRLVESNGDAQRIPELMAAETVRALTRQGQSEQSQNDEKRMLPELRVSSETLTKLRQLKEELNWRIGILKRNLGEHHAQVIAANTQLDGINNQINAEVNHVIGSIQNAYDIAVSRQQKIEASLQRLTSARGNSEVYLKLQQLRRVADADRKLYESYLSQFNEISQRRTLQDASARIISPATLPGSPSSPRRMLFYALGGVVGLGGGFLLALLIEFLKSDIKSGSDVEQSFGYPVVGIIPFVPSQKKSRGIVYERLLHRIAEMPLSQFSEAVHAMRISLELSSANPKVILVTSSLPAEGKSAAAILLAASSAGSGRRTVLLDCDLRQQATSGVFRSKHQPGLSELLRGTAELMDVISKDPATKTFVIPAGSIVPNPADLLMSQPMRDLIAELRAEFDYIVLDTAPLLPVVDALALATIVDKVLMIVEWGRTPRASISEAFKVLRPEAHRIAGIVLNKVDLKQLQGYSYRRGYHYRSVSKYFSNA